MMLVSLVIGVSLAAASTERVEIRLILSTSLAWSFVPVLQLLTGLVLTRGTPQRFAALDAYFGTHAPWSLWILGVHALFVVVGPARDAAEWVALTAVVPAAWTARALVVLCRTSLGLSPGHARRRVAVHQALSYGLVLLYLDFAVRLGARLP